MSPEIQQHHFILRHRNGNSAVIKAEFDGLNVAVGTEVIAPPPPPKPKRLYAKDAKFKCPFCNTELEQDMFNSVYGCESGCEYVRIEIECPGCHKVAWDSGTFGYFETTNEKAEYRAEFMEEFAKELKRIAPERLKPSKAKKSGKS